MAVSRKYAGLPDLDAAPEIYETPDLTEDGSTEQTSTLRTDSPTPSEDATYNRNLVRANINREDARRRFEPAIVDAKNVNLSDAIGGNRQGYKTAHRRRRRRVRRDDGGEEYGDLSDGDLSEEEETLSKKLARLQREAEEIRIELARREREGEDFKDTVEHQQGGATFDDDKELINGVAELNKVLDRLKMASKPVKGETLEQEFQRQMSVGNSKVGSKQQNGAAPSKDSPPSVTSASSISAIAAFSDRLTALEGALGLPTITPNTNPTLIMPSLDSLNAQITSLRNTIAPPSSSITNAQKDHIDILTSRLHTLHVEADSLLNTRKAALQALSQLHDSRYRSSNSAVYARYRREARHRDSMGTGSAAGDEDAIANDDAGGRPTLKPRDSASKRGSHSHQDSAAIQEDKLYTDAFLEEQSSKITALYNTLPTIQSLQPLLPTVLERLRGLSVVHASASTAHADMSDIESRLKTWETDLKKWQTAVEGVEKGIEEAKVVMKENVDVVGGMVRNVEDRMDKLERRGRG